MKFSNDRLNDIYDRTSGYCHICRKKLAFKNYAAFGAHGAWEIEHSTPQAKGGTHRLNNLYAACISCNRSKGKASTRSARGTHGETAAPLSVSKRRSARSANAMVGAGGGALLGGGLAGPPGAIVGAVLGAILGHKKNPDKR